MDATRSGTGGSRRLSICTIGDLILDVIVLPDGPLAADADTPASIRLAAGGQAANVAAWASALGANSRLICALGTDGSSELAARELARYGVEICGPVVDGTGGVVVSLRSSHGQRTMASDRGVATRLSPGDINQALIAECDVLHVSGYCLLRQPIADAAMAAARMARRVTVDLASAPDIEHLGGALFRHRLQELRPEIVFATEAERAVVPGFDAEWVVKLGADGARFPEGLYPAPSVDVIDTTGAGDALAAGYLVGGPELAIEAASRSVGLIGAMPSFTGG